MANFPLSVYAPSAVANGQTIDASRDNNQDAELTAIEAGYLQGSAPLNSSNATVANLSVTGGSTLGNAVASSLTVSAGSSFAVRPVMPPPTLAFVTLDSTKTVGSSASCTLAWTGEVLVTNSSMHSTGTNPERLVPQSTGMYAVTAQVRLGSLTSTGSVALTINDSTGDAFGAVQYGASSQTQFLQVTGYKRFDVLGGFAVVAYFQTGQSTVSFASGSTGTWAMLRKL